MTSLSKPVVLVTGGTGNQGGAAVAHLLASQRARVRVLTRDPDSAKARALASRGVELVRGDFDDAAALHTALAGVSAAFSVQGFRDKGGVVTEERRGKAFADAVKRAGTPHLVYSSVDGAERASGVPHFESKWRVEQYIRELGLPATILRPVAFMENFAAAAFPRSMFLGILRVTLGNAKRLQLVSTSDIGWFAARALENPERYSGRVIALAGDELNVGEIIETYRAVKGHAPTPFPAPRFLPKLMPKEISSMLYWFAEYGYQADIAQLRKENPALLSFASWLDVAR